MGNLSTPKGVQKLQTALHAKAKAEAGYRFYTLYDKISREDILAHAYAQCRSNKGAPGVDGQDFADIEAYGVQRWLGELALALRQETYRPDPIRRVFIPKANGKLRPLGISTLRDRVCMTAAMLVLEPIFEADLPPEQYAYRPGRNAQQAVVEVGALLDHGHPEVELLSYVLDLVGIRPEARYVAFIPFANTNQNTGVVRALWDSIDMADALHPQTLLAYGMNGKSLPTDHGAPVRLRLARLLGYKNTKYLSKIIVTDDMDFYRKGLGPWYGGI